MSIEMHKRRRLTRVLGTAWAFSSLGLTEGDLETWSDESGNNDDLTESTNPPTATENSIRIHPGVDFTSPDTLDFGSTYTRDGSFTIILLGTVATLGTNSDLTAGTDALTITAAGEVSMPVAGVGTVRTSGADIQVDTPTLIEVQRATSGPMTVWVDGVNFTDAPQSETGILSLDGLAGTGLTGTVFHAQVVERFLSTIELRRLRRLFIRRYGLTGIAR